MTYAYAASVKSQLILVIDEDCLAGGVESLAHSHTKNPDETIPILVHNVTRNNEVCFLLIAAASLLTKKGVSFSPPPENEKNLAL